MGKSQPHIKECTALLRAHADFTVVDDVSAIAPIVVSIANRCAEYESSGSTAWDATLDVRQRPEWCRAVQTKEFVRKPQSQVVLQSSMALDESEHMDGQDDGGVSTLAVDVLEDPPVPAVVSALEQYESLKLRQQVQMQALMQQQTQVIVARARLLVPPSVAMGTSHGCPTPTPPRSSQSSKRSCSLSRRHPPRSRRRRSSREPRRSPRRNPTSSNDKRRTARARWRLSSRSIRSHGSSSNSWRRRKCSSSSSATTFSSSSPTTSSAKGAAQSRVEAVVRESNRLGQRTRRSSAAAASPPRSDRAIP